MLEVSTCHRMASHCRPSKKRRSEKRRLAAVEAEEKHREVLEAAVRQTMEQLIATVEMETKLEEEAKLTNGPAAKQIFTVRIRTNLQSGQAIVHDTVPRKERSQKEVWRRPFMAEGRGIAFRPYPGLGVETTMERPAPKTPSPNLVEALEKITHFNELFVDNGKALEGLMQFTKDPNGKAGELRMDPSVHGPLLQRIFSEGFTLKVDEKGKPTFAYRSVLEERQRGPKALEFAAYL